ncbi:MAG: acyl-CoA dehydrogenase family protein, partial [Gammaproteobacteria bacterium]
TDNTKDLIKKISLTNDSIKFLPRSKPKSLPLSILDGINFAKSDDVMWLDADVSMTPLAMGKLLRTYFDYKNTLNEKVIIGSRFIDGGGYKGVKDVKNQSILSSIKNVKESNDSVFGMLLSILINKLLSFLFHTELTDLTSGFIVLNKELINPQVFEDKEYGEYFIYLMNELPQERLSIAVGALAAAESVLEQTIDYVKDRKAFGNRLADLQNTQFELADMSAQLTQQRIFIDQCIAWHIEGKLDAIMASKAKLLATDTQFDVINRCLQLHGGYGDMWEYPVARAFADSRVLSINGGANELMKLIIGRDLVK